MELASRARTAINCHYISVEEIDEATVKTTSYLLLTSAENGKLTALSTGKYEDQFRKSADD